MAAAQSRRPALGSAGTPATRQAYCPLNGDESARGDSSRGCSRRDGPRSARLVARPVRNARLGSARGERRGQVAGDAIRGDKIRRRARGLFHTLGGELPRRLHQSEEPRRRSARARRRCLHGRRHRPGIRRQQVPVAREGRAYRHCSARRTRTEGRWARLRAAPAGRDQDARHLLERDLRRVPAWKASRRYSANGPSGSYADDVPVTFWSGFVLTRAPACIPLDIHVDEAPAPRRAELALGRRCI